MTRRCAALALLAVLLTGCGGGAAAGTSQAAGSAAPSPGASAPGPSATPACPADGAGEPWPRGVPADLPVPPTTRIGTTERRPDGLTLVRFSTSQSLRQGILFVTGSLQPAGYALGRGDAEAVEADVPFTKGAVRGLMKMVAQAPCSTQWVLALQTQKASVAPGAPLAPRQGSPSASPLPFG